ncbi:MAG: AAA family ATPase, partial [Planctomycetes bacterium]|nr:AAA family ATPase [Planctomycetota bacterium]
MLLSRIEIHGFKSFADRTEFELDRGVTCLVGPNGCGKSNVVDAVKWALGEQRPTALRGDSMGDVVFKGNGSRPAMGFAEVTLVFDNANGGLAIETSEVAISRRLFRSGESEYLINRQPCRLKDVRELLVDTGLGQNAYAVLEQGRIDAVLAANPAERRSVFEEAAGIQRFRLRKREAARKLERVDQNLLRVADLIDELEKRVRSLKIQAGRARSYIALSDRLTALKTMVFLSTAADMAERAAGLQDELDEARRRDGASEAALGPAARAVEEADAEALVIRDAIARDRNRRVEVRAEHDNCATRRAALEQREAESRQAAQERGRQAAELEAEAAARASEARRLAEDEARLRAELARAEALAAERRAALERARAAAAAREAFLARLDADIVDLAEEELRLSNALASLESRTRGLRGARERLVRREAELAGLLEAVRLEAARVEGSLARLGGEARERAESIAAARAELADRIERGAETARRLAAVQASAARKESRKETLDGVIEKMEGVDEGSRALVRAARGDGA